LFELQEGNNSQLLKAQFEQNSHKILVIGAGRGGIAMIELFFADQFVRIVGIVDINPLAPALVLAAKHGIPCYTNLVEAIANCQPCIAFNLSDDENATAYAESHLGSANVVGGFQARFLWKVITQLKQTNEQLLHLAHFDSLTKLPNRIMFYDRLNQAISRALREKEIFSTMYLDLDGFKRINDSLGHDAGDKLLEEVSKRIVSILRDSDTVARMGGDEFTVILCNVQSIEGIKFVANKIIDAIADPYLINGQICLVSVSIGISVFPNNGNSPDQLLKLADEAMYMAKQNGKNCYKICAV
jgi:diguanylate cyclase (GGDEF)-like protein